MSVRREGCYSTRHRNVPCRFCVLYRHRARPKSTMGFMGSRIIVKNEERFYVPSDLETAKKGTDSLWVLLLTGPLWPWWTGLSHATRGTPLRERTFPPTDSIRLFSEGTSGLWSAVRGTAWSFLSLFNLPSAAPESPTWAMYSVLPFKITTVAVVPDVLGSPCLVRGQESADKIVRRD